MICSEGGQLCGGQTGDLAARHRLELVFVVGQQAVAEAGRGKRPNLVGRELHKISRLDGTDLGAVKLTDLSRRQLFDLRLRERRDIRGGQRWDIELANLSGRKRADGRNHENPFE